MKVKLVGMSEASTEYGVCKRGEYLSVSDDVARSLACQLGMWEIVPEEKKMSPAQIEQK